MFAPNFNFPDSLNPAVNTAKVRFEHPSGIQVVFTNAASLVRFDSSIPEFPSALTFIHPFVHPNSPTPPVAVNENLIFVNNYSSYQNFATIPHEIGHTFSLPPFRYSLLNLMCEGQGCFTSFSEIFEPSSDSPSTRGV